MPSIVDKRVPYDASMPIRKYAVSGMTVHGVAGLSLQGTSDQFDNSDGVNSNYLIGPSGEIWLKVSEARRAYTSGSPTDGGKGADFDHKRITVEIVNTGDIYSFSQASIDSLIWLAADVGKRNGFVYNRAVGGNFEGHRELWERYRASYPTACPTTFPLDAAAVAANSQIAGGSDSAGEDEEMTLMIVSGRNYYTLVTASDWVDLPSPMPGSLQSAVLKTYGANVLWTAAEETALKAWLPKRGTVTGGGTVDLTPVLNAIAAGEAQDVAALNSLLTAIGTVDEATLATFGLKRA